MTMMPQDFICDDSIEDFVAAGCEKLNMMEECLAIHNEASLATLKRNLHSLKGNAQTFGFHDLAGLCHRMEDEISDMKTWTVESRSHVSVFLVHIDVSLGQLRRL